MGETPIGIVIIGAIFLLAAVGIVLVVAGFIIGAILWLAMIPLRLIGLLPGIWWGREG